MNRLKKILSGLTASPLKILTAAIFLNCILVGVVGSIVWGMYQSLARTSTETLELQKLVGTIARLHEVLTTSARMAAATGDPQWEEHYQTTDQELDYSLAQLAMCAREAYEKSYAAQTKRAYTKLIEIESLVFALAKAGRKLEASNLLSGRDYQQSKKLYADGLRELDSAVQARIGLELRAFRVRLWNAAIVAGLSLAVLVGAWSGVLVLLKRYLAERELAERTVLEEKELLLVTLESISDAVIATDRAGRVLLVNSAAEALVGVTQKDTSGRQVRELYKIIDEKTGKQYVSPVDYVLNTGQAYQLSNHTLLIAGDGSRRFIEQSAAPIRDKLGDVLGVVLVIRDVTARKQSENALRESEEKYRTIIENMEEGYYEVGLLGNMALFNDSLTKILGYSSGDLTGMNYQQFVEDSSRRPIQAAFDQVYKTNNSTRVTDLRILKKDGSLGSVDCSISLVTDHEGNPTGFRGILRDMTERKRLEEQVRQSAKMEAIGTLAGGIAHDFNNILFVIMGYCELALDSALLDSRLRSHLEPILAAAKRAKDLVDQILTFSRKADQQRRVVKTGPIVKETLKFLRASIPSTVEIRARLAADVDTIMADPTQFHQVLMNLCSNAAHAMREGGGVLEVSLDNRRRHMSGDSPAMNDMEQFEPFWINADWTRQVGGDSPSMNDDAATCLVLTVSDTGHGMPPDVLERVFDPYFTTKAKGQGTGLGLSVVHGIVESLSGHIDVSSEVGKGTTFHVYLPIVHKEETLHIEERPCVVSAAGEHILLVDDEESIVKMSTEMLQEMGYRVSGESDSLKALARFSSDPGQFDLVITDMTMPKLTGTELTEKLRTVRPDIPVILCTGFSGLVSEADAEAVGLAAMIMKPVSKSQFSETIRSVLSMG